MLGSQATAATTTRVPAESWSLRRRRRDGEAGAQAACPLTTSIFLRIATEVAWDELPAGADIGTVTPFWRAVDPRSELAGKLRYGPDWIARQRAAEHGHCGCRRVERQLTTRRAKIPEHPTSAAEPPQRSMLIPQPGPQPGHDPLEGIDAKGTITTGAHCSRIPDAFRPVLEAVIRRLDRAPGTPSLYVYGSVATGMARVGRSDVDLVTIGLDATIARQWGQEFSTTFSGLCRGVEIGPAETPHYQGLGDEAHGNRVFLRHYCVHLSGPDPGAKLPDFAADRAAARGFNGDIGLRAAQWRQQRFTADPAWLGRRLARKTLFAVAGLVSIHDAIWTTDRTAAARRWGAVRPDLATALDMLVAWGDGESAAPSAQAIQQSLDDVVVPVVADFRDRIGLWAPAASDAT